MSCPTPAHDERSAPASPPPPFVDQGQERGEEATRLLRRVSNLGFHPTCRYAIDHAGRPCTACALTVDINAFLATPKSEGRDE